jgi:predicted TIM-barrel fold metal-dependent hydrolase
MEPTDPLEGTRDASPPHTPTAQRERKVRVSLFRLIGFGVSSLLVLEGCALGGHQAREEGGASAMLRRGQIVPLVDHHQHVFGPDLIDPPTNLLPEAPVPPELEKLLRERERISGTRNVADVFATDAQVLNIFFDTDSWVTGHGAIANVVEEHGAGLRFVPNGVHSDGSAAFLSGIVHADDQGEYDKHFSLGVKRDAGGRWRIATEAITNKVQNPFREPLDVKTLIMRLDDAGIQRATVMSTAFWLASPRRKRVENERERVRAANDWVIRQTAEYPDRLIPFCGVNALSDYSIEELQRCAAEPRVRGMKLHFANALVDLKNPEHLPKVKAFFRAANQSGMAIVVHLWPRGEAGPEYARIFIDEVLPESPDIPVQIAHLGSGAPDVFEQVLGVYADAIAAKDPRVRNLYLDVTEIILEDTPQALVDTLARRFRQMGLDRILFGSDTPLPRYRPPPLQAWATFRRRIPLSDAELRIIAGNVAPYLERPRASRKTE